MPNYDYKCQACGHVFEEFQAMTDEPLQQCPECGGEVKRLIGAGAGLIFKGSGFYITDYKNNKKSNTPAAGPAAAAATDSKPDKKDAAANKDHSAAE
ncbi:zinc ribbon domain-containing protein [bacterium]|nr:zinc ribbon domain-containing protein [bacterium]